ncbi:MAG: hypothetical protein H6810_10800 [Phycisphaeraceae bacterium]|nr:MAG: hypothetical protein H6810_10800 [Phycisphaeraceae bacterium]
MQAAIVRTGIAVLAAAAAFASGQITTTTIASGDWNNPAVWDSGVPGPLDTAVVAPGDTVWLATAGVPANPMVLVDQIDVMGTILSDSSVGQSMTLRVGTLNVFPGGVVKGQDGGAAHGGTVTVAPAVFGLPLNINNDGSILGGTGVCGGNLLLYGNADGSDLAAPNTTITSNGGTFRAGDSGGLIWIAAGTVNLTNATIHGGDVTAAGPLCGRGGQAGPIYISTINCTLNGTTNISGGDTFSGPNLGGVVFIRSLNNLFIDTPSSVLAGTPGGPGCPGVLTYAGNTSTILGTVSPAPGVGCYVWDPPTLIAAGDMNVDAGEIQIAGETFDATALNASSAPHFMATDKIEITLKPGGSLNTTGLIPGVPYFSAPQIIIHGDVHNADGVALEEFIDGQIAYFDAKVWRDIALSPGVSLYTTPGTTVYVPVQTMNVGAQTEQATLEVSDSMGWMTPISELRSLPQGFTIYKIIEVNVPASATPGDVTVLHATTATTDGVLSEEMWATVEVVEGAGGPCNPADLNGDGLLDLQDIGAFIDAFLAGDVDVADLNGDGVLDLQDINRFVGAFRAGCQ